MLSNQRKFSNITEDDDLFFQRLPETGSDDLRQKLWVSSSRSPSASVLPLPVLLEGRFLRVTQIPKVKVNLKVYHVWLLYTLVLDQRSVVDRISIIRVIQAKIFRVKDTGSPSQNVISMLSIVSYYKSCLSIFSSCLLEGFRITFLHANDQVVIYGLTYSF